MLKEFLNSRGAGVVAGTVTVVLGMGAIAALALGSSNTRTARLGDPTLNLGSSVLDATVVTSAGANDPASARPVAAGEARGTDPAAATPARADGRASRSAAPSAHAPDMSLARSGSAEVYRTMLATPGPLESSIARLASVSSDNQSRRFAAGAIAGGVGGAAAGGFVRASRPTNVANNPYATGDLRRPAGGAGSDAVRSPEGNSSSAGSRGGATGGPAMGTQPVGPGTPPTTGAPASSGAAVVPPVVNPASPPPGAKSPSPSPSPNTAPGANAPINPPGLVSTTAPVPTDVLGNGRQPAGTPAPGGSQTPAAGSGGQPQEPGAVPPPSTSIVGPSAVVTPEPSTWLLLGSGLVVLGMLARRQRGTARA